MEAIILPSYMVSEGLYEVISIEEAPTPNLRG